jgi:hypothetical protein
MKDVLGECIGLRFKDRGDGGILIQLLIEDDENWYEKDFIIHSYWIKDLKEVIELAEVKLEQQANKDSDGWGYTFRDEETNGDSNKS